MTRFSHDSVVYWRRIYPRLKEDAVKRNVLIGGALLALLVALGIGQGLLEKADAAQSNGKVMAPRFEVDPFWPKPMPNNWVFGMTIGVGVDEKDQVWIIHRGNDPAALDRTEYAFPPPQAAGGGRAGAGAPGTGRGAPAAAAPTGQPQRVSECCTPAPPVVAFDAAGNVVQSWGGPSLHPEWPESNHGIVVDHKGNVWIGGNGQPDSHILKFTREGKFVAQFGKKGARRDPANPNGYVRNADDLENFGRVAKVFIDSKANEAYVSDGYFNKRVAVIDMDSGKVKRYWGGYGEKPDNETPPPYNPKEGPSRQFRTPVHCAEVSNDGFVYVCDRPNDRIQVFTKEGKFVKEKQIFPETLSDGSVWDIAFSRDQQQKFLYVADGANEHVYIVDRQSLEILTSFGTGGRQPGMFFGVHSIATDSKGNIYTTETYTGKRLQKFVYKGLVPVTTKTPGAPWPTRTTQ
jgi:DNA-binding beta-propeller fold protein YncE